MVLDVSGSGIGDGQMISGVFYLPLVVNITYSDAVGNVTGSTILQLVASGNLSGLPLSSVEKRNWKHGDTTETSANSFVVVTIRED